MPLEELAELHVVHDICTVPVEWLHKRGVLDRADHVSDSLLALLDLDGFSRKEGSTVGVLRTRIPQRRVRIQDPAIQGRPIIRILLLIRSAQLDLGSHHDHESCPLVAPVFRVLLLGVYTGDAAVGTHSEAQRVERVVFEEFDKGSELRLKSEALYLLDTLTFNSTLNPKPPFVVTGLKKPF